MPLNRVSGQPFGALVAARASARHAWSLAVFAWVQSVRGAHAGA